MTVSLLAVSSRMPGTKINVYNINEFFTITQSARSKIPLYGLSISTISLSHFPRVKYLEEGTRFSQKMRNVNYSQIPKEVHKYVLNIYITNTLYFENQSGKILTLLQCQLLKQDVNVYMCMYKCTYLECWYLRQSQFNITTYNYEKS